MGRTGPAGRPEPAGQVAGWAMVSAAAAPVVLIGGWTVAQWRQPPGYDAVTDTISALAAPSAADRWVMSAALVGLGACHLVTALGLRCAATTGRLLLAAGGVATVLVAAFPLPSTGGSTAHTLAAAVAFLALAGWPALAAPRSRLAWTGTAVLLAFVAWFTSELSGGTVVGLTERLAAGAEAFAPLAAVLLARFHRRVPSPTPGR